MLTKDWLTDCDTVEKLREEYAKRIAIDIDNVTMMLGGTEYEVPRDDVLARLELPRMFKVLVLKSIRERIDRNKLLCVCCDSPLRISCDSPPIVKAYHAVYLVCNNIECRAYNNPVIVALFPLNFGSLDAVDETVNEAVNSIKQCYNDDFKGNKCHADRAKGDYDS